jgi:hypothetical protein
MEALTPEFFNTLVIVNIVVGMALATYRFTRDMTRPAPTAEDQREQAYDEHSPGNLDDTQPSNLGDTSTS